MRRSRASVIDRGIQKAAPMLNVIGPEAISEDEPTFGLVSANQQDTS
jgi:hypothetical protein